MLLALLLIAQTPCRELHDAPPRLGGADENIKMAIVECAGDRVLTISKRSNATAEWAEVSRLKVTAPGPNQSWFFDGALCATKGSKGDDAKTNHAVLAHARAALGEFPEWTPIQSYHVSSNKGVWVKDDAKKMICHPEPL
jgi:hypothetical protein